MRKVILVVMLLPLLAFSQIVIKTPSQNKFQAAAEEMITISDASCGDIIISEIMADPDPLSVFLRGNMSRSITVQALISALKSGAFVQVIIV